MSLDWLVCPACLTPAQNTPALQADIAEGFALLTCDECGAQYRHVGGEPEASGLIYWYANRWYDSEAVPHYFGLQTIAPTLAEAQRLVHLNMIDTPVDLVYGPCSLDELFDFLADVNNCRLDEDHPDDLGDIGTFNWLQ